MGDLKQLAFKEMAASIDQLEPPKLLKEAFSDFTSRQD
jgi:hypothetical protein